MALAPEVYSFTRDVNQGKRPPGAIRRAVDVIGKTALAAGAIAGGVYLAKNFGTLELDDEPHIGTPPQPQGFATASTDVTPPTTSDRYGQDIVPHQTAVMGLLRGTSPEKPTVVDSEEKPATQSHVITSSQSFSPGSELEQLSAKEVPHSPIVDPLDAVAQQKSAAIVQAVLAAKAKSGQRIKQDRLSGIGDLGGDTDEYGTLDLYLQHQQAVHRRNVSERVQKFLGTELGSTSLLGQGSVRGAEAFRQTPGYAEMMRGAGASMEPEELVGGSQPTVFTEVRPTSATRIATENPATPLAPKQAAAPVVVTKLESPSAPVRRSVEAEEAAAFAAKALALLPRAQREALLSGQADAPIVTQQPEAVRVGKPVKAAIVDPLDAVAQQKSAAIVQAVLAAKAKSGQRIKQDRLSGIGDVGGDTDEYGTLDLYLQHQQAVHRRNVSERVQKFLGAELGSTSLPG
jgi:hypothetical protein